MLRLQVDGMDEKSTLGTGLCVGLTYIFLLYKEALRSKVGSFSACLRLTLYKVAGDMTLYRFYLNFLANKVF